MTVCDWDWQAISGFYQGTSGLIAGIGAVYGAYRLGLRQNRISERQTEIQERQIEISLRSHHADLFDRRYAAYEEITDGLYTMMFSQGDDQNKAYYKYLHGRRMAKILFRDEVNATFDLIDNEVSDFRSSERRIKGEDAADRTKAMEENRNSRTILRDRMLTMVEVLGHEIKLGDR